MGPLLPADFLQVYVSRRSSDLEILKLSLENNSVQEFNRIGHQILGNARTFGFLDLEKIAEKLNELTPKSLKEKGPELLLEFEIWITCQKQSADKKLNDF